MDSVNIDNQSSSKSDVQQVNKESPQTISQKNEVRQIITILKINNLIHLKNHLRKKYLLCISFLIIGVIGFGFLFQDNIKNVIKSEKDVLITGTAVLGKFRLLHLFLIQILENFKTLLVL